MVVPVGSAPVVIVNPVGCEFVAASVVEYDTFCAVLDKELDVVHVGLVAMSNVKARSVIALGALPIALIVKE